MFKKYKVCEENVLKNLLPSPYPWAPWTNGVWCAGVWCVVRSGGLRRGCSLARVIRVYQFDFFKSSHLAVIRDAGSEEEMSPKFSVDRFNPDWQPEER